MARLTKVSVDNCKVADYFKIEKSNIYEDCYLVKAYRGENMAYLTCGSGSVMEYPTQKAAVRSIRRIRPDAPITEI